MSSEALFLRSLTRAARLCGFDLEPDIVSLFDQALAPLGYEVVAEAIDRLAYDLTRGKPFPSIRAIKEAVTGQLSLPGPELRQRDESEARTAANLAIMAVSKFGSVNGTSEAAMQRLARIRAWVGELGWACVELKGGWNEWCRSLESYDMLPTVEAQMRELAKAQLDRARRGVDLAPPSLPPGPGRRGDGRGLSAVDITTALPEGLRYLAAKKEDDK